ncbi:SDR family oxidoreductase [Tropicimonas isoalkanivorans]|uniref:NAD(P)H dehydrogenase (Quinone) n=1 Tax=Tropicimonas isoalkanivorans TaxID=441112 RepID=A0A1I1M7A8_9RHOB|nr:SDR family oxidoreductase [Tropicimonas isoalkanivorans]SFC81234.1 NAD(P)H dehydrogenase (quinone) [Tropicimonas isoalkanivorans]
MTIAVTGATGQLGQRVIEHLKARAGDEEIIALARTPEKAEGLGVTARAFDYDQADALADALEGVDTLLLISGSEVGKRAPQHRNVIVAAKAAGVGRIVYTSLLRADTSPLSLAPEHLETEAMIRESGIPFTLLRNGWYAENHAASIPTAVQLGALYGAAGEGRISWATRDDFAEAAAVVLTAEGQEGKVYELAGDNGHTLTELAGDISGQTGKAIPYTDLPEADYAAALSQAGLPEPWPQALASFDAKAADGALYNDGNDLSKLIGRPTTPLSEIVAAGLRG